MERLSCVELQQVHILVLGHDVVCTDDFKPGLIFQKPGSSIQLHDIYLYFVPCKFEDLPFISYMSVGFRLLCILLLSSYFNF